MREIVACIVYKMVAVVKEASHVCCTDHLVWSSVSFHTSVRTLANLLEVGCGVLAEKVLPSLEQLAGKMVRLEL